MSNREPITVVVPAYNEELLIRGTLDALTRQKTDIRYGVVVVDNGSSDDTPNIVSDYPGVTLLQEPTKGTGTAANTGFRYAIDERYSEIVMRTDADTVPNSNWVDAANSVLNRKPQKMLITGFDLPLRDAYYRRRDEALLPLSYIGYRFGVAALSRSLWPIRVARGHNMAIRSVAFDKVGGFPDCAIDDEDDDIELTRRIHEAFGFDSLDNVHAMVVRTSMRRIRKIRYSGLVSYYLNPTSKPNRSVRNRLTSGNVDIR